MNRRSQLRRFALILAAAFVGVLIFGIFYALGINSRPSRVAGTFEVSSTTGILSTKGSPPREALIELSGDKVIVKQASNEGSALGMKFKDSVGASFTAEPRWFVSFDENHVLHYGVHPKWVNRIEDSPGSASIISLQAKERDDYLEKVAKAVHW